MKALKTIITSFKNTKILIVTFFILSVLIAYLTTYIPVIIQYFIDILLNQNAENPIIEGFINLFNNKISFIVVICILLLIVQGIVIISTYLRAISKNKIIQEFQSELKLKLFNHIQNLTYQDFYRSSLADLVQSMADDVNNIVKFVEKQFTYILDIILIVIFAIVQLANLDLRLSLVMVIAITIITILSIWYFKKSKSIIDYRIQTQKEMYTALNDNYSNIKFMKLNNLQNKEIERFKIVNNKNYYANKRKVELDSLYNMLCQNIVKGQAPFILILSIFLYINGYVSIGSIYVAINYANKVTRAFIGLADILEFFNLCIASYKRLNRLLDLTIEDSNEKNKKIEIKDTTISFKNASIKVNNKTILKDLNLEINQNEKVMIVGCTGSGKSILLKTLVGFYDYEGSIKIGDYEIKDLNKKNIRENICLLLQDSYLFSKTIAENIRILVPYMSYQEMVDLSKFFSIHDDVIKFKERYESKIGRNGMVLSKGQKQRLVLVRSYTKPKPVMIFDDSFSAIDRINKKKILQNLMLLEDNSTKIVVTHDIELAPKFEKIIYIDNGKVLCGTHNYLLENSNYRTLYNLNLNKIGEEYA